MNPGEIYIAGILWMIFSMLICIKDSMPTENIRYGREISENLFMLTFLVGAGHILIGVIVALIKSF